MQWSRTNLPSTDLKETFSQETGLARRVVMERGLGSSTLLPGSLGQHCARQ